MITIKLLKAIPVKVGKVLVTWDFNTTFEDFSEYTFRLQRSFSPESDFETILEFIDDTQFLDEVTYVRVWSDLSYRVVATHNPTGEEWISELVGFAYPPNMETLEMIRRNDVLLENKRYGIGVPVGVFIRKKAGVNCACWDQEKQRSSRSSCDDCFGTRYEGGFYDPILTWVNFNPDNKIITVPQWGESEPQEGRFFMSDYPTVAPKDLVLDPVHQYVWIVDAVQTSARRMVTIHQLCTINFIDRSHVYYTLFEKYADFFEEVRSAAAKIKRS